MSPRKMLYLFYYTECPISTTFFSAVRHSYIKVLGHGYVRGRLKSSLRKFYGRYGDLIKHYEVRLSFDIVT